MMQPEESAIQPLLLQQQQHTLAGGPHNASQTGPPAAATASSTGKSTTTGTEAATGTAGGGRATATPMGQTEGYGSSTAAAATVCEAAQHMTSSSSGVSTAVTAPDDEEAMVKNALPAAAAAAAFPYPPAMTMLQQQQALFVQQQLGQQHLQEQHALLLQQQQQHAQLLHQQQLALQQQQTGVVSVHMTKSSSIMGVPAPGRTHASAAGTQQQQQQQVFASSHRLEQTSLLVQQPLQISEQTSLLVQQPLQVSQPSTQQSVTPLQGGQDTQQQGWGSSGKQQQQQLFEGAHQLLLDRTGTALQTNSSSRSSSTYYTSSNTVSAASSVACLNVHHYQQPGNPADQNAEAAATLGAIEGQRTGEGKNGDAESKALMPLACAMSRCPDEDAAAGLEDDAELAAHAAAAVDFAVAAGAVALDGGSGRAIISSTHSHLAAAAAAALHQGAVVTANLPCSTAHPLATKTANHSAAAVLDSPPAVTALAPAAAAAHFISSGGVNSLQSSAAAAGPLSAAGGALCVAPSPPPNGGGGNGAVAAAAPTTAAAAGLLLLTIDRPHPAATAEEAGAVLAKGLGSLVPGVGDIGAGHSGVAAATAAPALAAPAPATPAPAPAAPAPAAPAVAAVATGRSGCPVLGGGGGAAGGGGGGHYHHHPASSTRAARRGGCGGGGACGVSCNEVWRERLRLLEPFLDVEGILLLKQCCRLFYRHKYRPAEGILSFQQLRGYDPKVLMEQVLPLVCRSVHAGVRQRGLLLDFSHCVLIKDRSIARLMDAVHGEPEENQILGKLKGLHLNYCNEITEKGLAAMFTTYLPHLEVLRMRCARSTELTFISSLSHLSSERWPSLVVFDASFTYLWLDAATAIADRLFDNAARLTAKKRQLETHLRKQKREKRRLLLLQQQQELLLQQQQQQLQQQQLQHVQQDGEGVQQLEELELFFGKEESQRREEGVKKEEDGEDVRRQLLVIEEIPVLQSPVLAPQDYCEQIDDLTAAAAAPSTTTAAATDTTAAAINTTTAAANTTAVVANVAATAAGLANQGEGLQQQNQQQQQNEQQQFQQTGYYDISARPASMLGGAGGGGEAAAAAGACTAGGAAASEKNEATGFVFSAHTTDGAAAAAASVSAEGAAAAPAVCGGVLSNGSSMEIDEQEEEDMRAIADIFITPTMEILGSVASKNLLLKIGLDGLYRSFCCALTSGDVEGAAHIIRCMQRELSDLASRAPYNSSHLLVLQQFRGAELLVNAPLTVETPEEGGVNVATLPISTAIQKKDSDMLNLLLRSGAKIDVCDYLGKSPLYLACEAGRKDFVQQLLLQHAASPQAADIRSAFSPLHMAIKRGDIDILKLLLKKGASLDVRCPAVKTYKSALFVACETNSTEAMHLCLKAGADPNWRGQNSNTPTLLAYQLSSAWLPQFVAAGAGRPLQRRWVLTDLLSNAIFRGDVPSVELLTREFPDLLMRDHQLWSKPLIQAAKQGKAEVISALLAAGCPVDVRTENGQTPLMAAAQEDFVGCVQLLLDHGANLDDTDDDGLTALHVAAMENRGEVAKLLLLRGCDVNVGDGESGETALMMAIRMRNEKMALQILEAARNIDLEKRNVKGETALLYAIFFGQYPVAGQLMDRGAVSVSDHIGDSAYVMACERMMTQGADKRVLRKFMRLHKATQTQTLRCRSQAFAAAAAAATGRSEEHWSAFTAGEESAASGVDSGPDGVVRQQQQHQQQQVSGTSTSTSSRKGSSGRVRGMKSIKMCVSSAAVSQHLSSSSSSSSQLHNAAAAGGSGVASSGVGGLLLGSGSLRSSSGRASAAAAATDRQGIAKTVTETAGKPQSAAAGGVEESAAQSGVATTAAGTAATPQRRSKGFGTSSAGKKLKLETKTVLQVAKLPITLFRAAKAK